MNRRLALALTVGALLLGVLTGCGSYAAAHDFNAPTPAKIFPGNWTRVETPGNFPSMIFECHGPDGVYEAMDSSSSPFVVRDDALCQKG